MENGTRTYKVVESDATGIAYAKDIAKDCGMTYESIRSKILREGI